MKKVTAKPAKAPSTNKAVLYCRVSSMQQVKKGNGLSSQESRMREFAQRRGYDVVSVFHDNLTGNTTKRPGMDRLLAHLRTNRREGRIVIIDDISRFARGVTGHWELRDLLGAAGGKLESPNMEFGESADSHLVENLLASVSQYHLQKNAEQTRNRMRGRFLNGYWPFIACIGFKFARDPKGAGSVLVRHEPIASIIQEGLEGYASGRFTQQIEVARFFESHPEFPKDSRGKVRQQLVKQIMTKPIYAGYLEAPEGWDLPLTQGKHEGMISFTTFDRIQKKLAGTAYAPARTDIREDFPLRGAVACACCGKALTSCWSKSKTGAGHAYYLCFGKGCTRYGKSIRRDHIEGDFLYLLQGLTPSPGLVSAARAMFKDAWDQRAAQAAQIARSCQRELVEVERQIGALLDRVVTATSDSVIRAYEGRITELENRKLLLAEQQQTKAKPQGFNDVLELAMRFLANPCRLWEKGNLEARKMVLKLTFAEHLAYCPVEGFRTPALSMPFKALGAGGHSMGALAEDRKPDARRLLRFLRNPSQLGEILSSGGGKGLIL